jgi:CheY-like chemotaxis protein
LLCDILENEYQAVCVTTSREALAVLAEQAIDVLLLDYHLPGGGADEVARRADQSGIPIVWMTGDPAAADKLNIDPQFLLAKPFSINSLLETLKKVEIRSSLAD